MPKLYRPCDFSGTLKALHGRVGGAEKVDGIIDDLPIQMGPLEIPLASSWNVPNPADKFVRMRHPQRSPASTTPRLVNTAHA